MYDCFCTIIFTCPLIKQYLCLDVFYDPKQKITYNTSGILGHSYLCWYCCSSVVRTQLQQYPDPCKDKIPNSFLLNQICPFTIKLQHNYAEEYQPVRLQGQRAALVGIACVFSMNLFKTFSARLASLLIRSSALMKHEDVSCCGADLILQTQTDSWHAFLQTMFPVRRRKRKTCGAACKSKPCPDYSCCNPKRKPPHR